MKNRITILVAVLIVAIFASSCGRTIYRGKYLKSNKYVKSKSRYHWWHAHGAKPRERHGGYW